MPTPEATDRELSARALAGDEGAFAALYERHAPMVVRTAVLVTGERGLAEDAVQEVFVRAYRHIADLTTADSAGPWLRRVTIRVAIDLVRRQRRWLRFMPWAPTSAEPPAQGGRETGADLAAALLELEAAPRAALVLRYYHDLTDTEVAREMGAPLGTVKSWLHRSLARLQQSELLAEYGKGTRVPRPPEPREGLA